MKRLLLRRRFFVGSLGFVWLSMVTVRACGPDFRPDVFVRPLSPDDMSSYARGNLGILQPTYIRRDLVLAYRYLTGGKLSANEMASYPVQPKQQLLTPAQFEQQQASERDELPVNQWIAALKKYTGDSQTEVPAYSEQGTMRKQPGASSASYPGNFVNCPAAAYKTAVQTLASRAQTFGRSSSALAEWKTGQLAVFANCSGGDAPVIPTAAEASSPELLRFDREYQIAAAYFYGTDFVEARKRFEAIAAEQASPWQASAGYLAARTLVRQAFFTKTSPNEEFDAGLMVEAQHRLEALLHDPSLEKMHPAIRAELNFVRLRTEQRARLKELAAALAGPTPDPDCEQHLIDLTFTLDQHLDPTSLREDADYYSQDKDLSAKRTQAYQAAATLRADSPLIDWIITFQSPSEDAHQHALAMWRQTKSILWLATAIAKAGPGDPPALLEAVAAVPQDSPAFTTIGFHQARLLIALNREDAARALVDAELPGIRKAGMPSAVNAFLGLRMQTARNLAEFLTYAPRTLLEKSSQAAVIACTYGRDGQQEAGCLAKLNQPQLDVDAASLMNFRFPMSLLVASAKSTELPENLRHSVAIAGWVRAVLLGDESSVAALAPLLPKSLQETAGASTGFPATLAMLRNPGVQPYLQAGIQRSFSYALLDNFRDNWWCGDWEKSWGRQGFYGSAAREPFVPAPFLTAEQRAAASQEAAKLAALSDAGGVWLGERVLAYAKEHPSDPDLPEALALTVRATHLGCSDGDSEARRLATAKAAFQLLHRAYPQSSWAKKTKVYS